MKYLLKRWFTAMVFAFAISCYFVSCRKDVPLNPTPPPHNFSATISGTTFYWNAGTDLIDSVFTITAPCTQNSSEFVQIFLNGWSGTTGSFKLNSGKRTT